MIALSIYLDPTSKKLQSPHGKFEHLASKFEIYFFCHQIPKEFLKYTIFELLQATNLKSSIKSQAPNLMLLAIASPAAPSEKTQPYFWENSLCFKYARNSAERSFVKTDFVIGITCTSSCGKVYFHEAVLQGQHSSRLPTSLLHCCSRMQRSDICLWATQPESWQSWYSSSLASFAMQKYHRQLRHQVLGVLMNGYMEVVMISCAYKNWLGWGSAKGIIEFQDTIKEVRVYSQEVLENANLGVTSVPVQIQCMPSSKNHSAPSPTCDVEEMSSGIYNHAVFKVLDCKDDDVVTIPKVQVRNLCVIPISFVQLHEIRVHDHKFTTCRLSSKFRRSCPMQSFQEWCKKVS